MTFSAENKLAMPLLEPLPYHRTVVNLLRKTESVAWDWAASHQNRVEELEAARASMLRATYRLDPEAHEAIHGNCRTAMAALGIDAPVVLYQAADGAMNASLCYIPGEIHLVFYGAILEKLSSEEMIALMGHELSHYLLWSINDGEFNIANRVFDHALAYPEATASHFETARLYSLCTELYADRGAAIAAQSANPAISTLVKTMTGLTNVDAQSYLRQSAELDKTADTSQGTSHPEIFLRVQALDKWCKHDQELDQWLEQRLRGPFSLAALDLPRQHDLTEMTRKFFTGFLADESLRSDAVITQIKRYFPDWSPLGSSLEEGALGLSLALGKVDKSVQDYFIALMLDLATVDRETRDEILVAGAKAARRFGALDNFRSALKRDLKLTRQNIDKLLAQADQIA